LSLFAIAAHLSIVLPASAQKPTVEQALQLKPKQPDVQFDRPAGDTVDQCRIAAEEGQQKTAWVVRGPAGELLRRFVDSNADNKIDLWCYYQSGIEVYRDIDADFNGKADQYRWLGTAGTRWGLDDDEDGTIDAWKVISPEEVTAQAVLALQTRDAHRFRNVLLNANELASLGLGKKLSTNLSERIADAVDRFEAVAAGHEQIGKNTQWIDFGGLRPGIVPAGTEGSTKDVMVYENVVAMIETDGKASQLPIGTLVRVGDGWRLISLPVVTNGSESTPQFVFFEAVTQQTFEAHSVTAGINEKTERLVDRLEKIDNQMAKVRGVAELAQLNGQRAETLEQLAEAAINDSDRDMWLMQFADTVGGAAQSGAFPGGTALLEKLRKQLEKSSHNKELVAHITFAHMSSDYALQLQSENADFSKVQDKWLARLATFLKKYPDSQDAPEAMLQLALAKEFAGEEDEANRWYTSIVKDFEDSPLASKAAGAKRRLECVGKPLSLSGRTFDGKSFDVSRLRGNVVLVHYWATWCEPCKQDMEVLAKLQRQFARKRFQIVGVNVDSDSASIASFFRTKRPGWTHLYEKGGLDSRLANEMGVFTLPVMLLLDSRGRVVNRQIHAGELEAEISKLLR